jgi:hypothetical protein
MIASKIVGKMAVKRTYGFVRSSLAAPVGLVTAGSEAAATTPLRPSGRGGRREAFSGIASVRRSGGQADDKSNESELHAGIVNPEEPKALTGSGQNRHAVGWHKDALGHTDNRTAGVVQGLNRRGFLVRKWVNPTSRPFGAGVAARSADGVAGRGCWRKRMPSRNRTDRGCDIAPLRKQADFQRVVRYEKAGRTTTGGNRK